MGNHGYRRWQRLWWRQRLGQRAADVMEAAAVVETAVGGGAASEMEAPGAETGTTVPEGDAGGAGEVEEEGEAADDDSGKGGAATARCVSRT